MTISFNTIPSNTLVPLFYAEMDNQAANTAQDSGASLLIGHANNGAEIVANSLVRTVFRLHRVLPPSVS